MEKIKVTLELTFDKYPTPALSQLIQEFENYEHDRIFKLKVLGVERIENRKGNDRP